MEGMVGYILAFGITKHFWKHFTLKKCGYKQNIYNF